MPEILIAARDEAAIVLSRGAVRELARSLGFTVVDQTRIATAVSEIVRNVVLYAKRGKIEFMVVGDRQAGGGIEVVVEDEGPGISDTATVLAGGFSTSGGFGRGISGARTLVDEFELESEEGVGTRVVMRKWP
ncbi:MAG: ATP-binding protein [Actinomycetota bacterium]